MTPHYLTLETLQALEADMLRGRDVDPWPWPPYGISERDESEQDWWERCPAHDELMRGGYCPVCGRR